MEILKKILIDAVPDDLREKFFAGTLRDEEIEYIETMGISNSYVCDGRVNPERAETMIGKPRLDNFQYCIEQAVKYNIPGDIIEAGVWRGGACIMAAELIKRLKSDKRIYVADSFEGLPKPDEKNYPADKGDPHHTLEHLKVSLYQVQENFKKYGVLNDNVVFIKGFFKNSLKNTSIKKLSVLRLDGDMYSSTIEVLDALYHKLSVGGYCIIDDYSLPACKQAVDDFRKQHGIDEKIIIIDWTGVYWHKNKEI
jgi:hypothetical protein